MQYSDPRFRFADHAVEAALDRFAHKKALRHHQATLEAVRAAFDDYGVLFFFPHGQADFAEPLRSGLLTTDGWLTLGDIFDLRSERARLAVPADELGFHGLDNRYIVEPGAFRVWIGPNSAEGLEGEFELRACLKND